MGIILGVVRVLRFGVARVSWKRGFLICENRGGLGLLVFNCFGSVLQSGKVIVFADFSSTNSFFYSLPFAMSDFNRHTNGVKTPSSFWRLPYLK